MGRLHCGGRLLIGGHNNQIKVGVNIGGGRWRGDATRAESVGGVLYLPESGVKSKEKKIQNNTRHGLRWLPTSETKATTNQKHARATKGVWARGFGRWGAQGGRESIVWGQSSWAGG
jgi:hypothetical protein